MQPHLPNHPTRVQQTQILLVLFFLTYHAAVTDPTALPVNKQTQLANRNILWTSVTSADQSIPLPLDSCCSISLVSANHAIAINTKRPSLQFKILPESIPVSVPDAKSNLSVTATMDVPITWSNGRESIFTMLVVPHLSWPILFGENHLHATKALADHDQPSITFRHPSRQFTVPCSLDNRLTGFTSTTAPASHAPSNNSRDNYQHHVGVTCLLTKTPDPKHGPMQVHLYQSPFYTIGIDYVGPLPQTPSGNKWIITAVCPYSSFLVAIPVLMLPK